MNWVGVLLIPGYVESYLALTIGLPLVVLALTMVSYAFMDVCIMIWETLYLTLPLVFVVAILPMRLTHDYITRENHRRVRMVAAILACILVVWVCCQFANIRREEREYRECLDMKSHMEYQRLPWDAETVVDRNGMSTYPNQMYTISCRHARALGLKIAIGNLDQSEICIVNPSLPRMEPCHPLEYQSWQIGYDYTGRIRSLEPL